MVKEPKVTMSGAQLGARVIALEAFVMILAEAVLDRPDVTADQAQEAVTRMAASAKALIKDTRHPEVIVQGEMFIDDLTERLADALPKMRDGRPG